MCWLVHIDNSTCICLYMYFVNLYGPLDPTRGQNPDLDKVVAANLDGFDNERSEICGMGLGGGA